jgi:phosphoribosylformimino-5-aminoimidazole carboxamide ribotide isomerase
MEIIPVIDLLNGQVVRAQRGERNRYLPIDSALSRSSKPLDVAQALLGLYPFNTLYIADLDAIQRHGNHFSTLAAIRQNHPNIDLWLDAGFGNVADCHPWRDLDVTFVVGSESLKNIESLRQMKAELGDEKLVLSLDWRGETALGPPELFQSPCDWPQRLIVMTLGKVGSYDGPDMERLKQISLTGCDRSIYAAGGVRGANDLQSLQAMGISGVLLASTLHDGHISQQELALLSP